MILKTHWIYQWNYFSYSHCKFKKEPLLKEKAIFSQWSFSHDLFMISPCIYLSRVRISPFKENYRWSTKPIECTNEIEWIFFGFIVYTQIQFDLECVLKGVETKYWGECTSIFFLVHFRNSKLLEYL